MLKLKDILLNEADVFGNTSPSSDDTLDVKDLEKEMGDSLKDLEKAFKSDGNAAKADVAKIEEGQINEALGFVAIFGMILAAPKVVELFIKGFSKLVKWFKGARKGMDAKDVPTSETAKWLIDGTHKWHEAYIKAVYYILKWTGIFRKAKIEKEDARMKAATLVYYTIIAGLAIYSGVGAVGAFKGAVSGAAHGGSFSIAGLESGMAAVKTAEVAEFLGELGLIGLTGTPS